MTTTKLLTAEETADRLRITPGKVKRLRLTGQLAYLPGRPVLIPDTAVEAYIAEATVKEASLAKALDARKRRGTDEETEAEVRGRARRFFAEQDRRKQASAAVKRAKADRGR